jgi:hypothetical protein
MFNILSYKGNANQVTLRFYLVLVRIAIIKRKKTNTINSMYEWIRKMWYMYVMKGSSAIKNVIMSL